MIDVNLIKTTIITRATTGLKSTAEFALARAQHHAPVRSIFDRRSSPRGAAIPKTWKTLRSAARYETFMRSRSRARRVDVAKGVAREQRRIIREAPPGKLSEATRQQLAGLRSLADATEKMSTVPTRGRRYGRTTTSFSGHVNSLIPVVQRGGVRAAGDLRRFDPSSGGLQAVPIVTQTRGNARTARGRPAEFGAFIQRPMSEGGSLTSRGKYEVAHARDARPGLSISGKRFAKTALFQGRVGGRLRGELTVRGPERHAGSVWYYVESPTEYAPYQEFGTSHNRPQPFLRPALYESRQVLRFEVRKAVDKRFNELPG